MKCPKCNSELIWQNDFDVEDFCFDNDQDGIVGVYTCANDSCDISDIHIFTYFDQK